MDSKLIFPENKCEKKYLFVDLRDFVDQMDSGDFSFSVFFSSQNKKSLSFPPFSNISKAELKAINFPKMNNDEMYFILDIYEFNGRLNSSDNEGSHDKFAVIHYDSSSMTPGSMKPARGKDFDDKIVVFNPIERSLNRLTVNIRKYGGNIINMSDIDSSLGSMVDFLNKYPVNFMIEFTCERY